MENKIALVAVKGSTFDHQIYESEEILLERFQKIKAKIITEGIFDDIVRDIDTKKLEGIDITTLVQASSISNRTEEAFLLYPQQGKKWNGGEIYFDPYNDRVIFYEHYITSYIRRTLWYPKLDNFRPSIRFRGYGNVEKLVKSFNKNHEYVHWHVYRGKLLKGRNFIEQGYSLRNPQELDWVYDAERLSAWGWHDNRFGEELFNKAQKIAGVADYLNEREITLYYWENVEDIPRIIEVFEYWS